MTSLEQLRNEIGDWVDRLFSTYRYPGKRESKIVRDAVQGYLILEPYEVAVLDSPPVQRLRYIHQTALAYLVYPSAQHTRFEHSLGLIKTVSSMADALRRRGKDQIVTEPVTRELRLAGLLHDTGHVLYSHLGETIMVARFNDLLTDALREGGELFENANHGEMLAYLILTSPRFKAFLDQVKADHSVEFDIERIGGYICGFAPAAEKYKADIINGPFDADKLDYLLRDCYFCGIKADVDVERLYNTIDIWDKAGEPRYLVMKQTGIPILEQILFNKMMLYTAIYHHQKIRALECMIRAVFEAIWEHAAVIKDKRLRFESVVDFFEVSEFQFLTLASQEEKLAPLVQNLLSRQLLKRCLVLSMSSVRDDTQREVFNLDKQKTRPPEDLALLRKRIFEEIPPAYQTSYSDLWIDLPKGPDINEDAVQCLVDVDEAKPRELSELFPSDDWLTSYELNKWKGHLFYTEGIAHRNAAADAAETVLRDEFGIKLEPLARAASGL